MMSNLPTVSWQKERPYGKPAKSIRAEMQYEAN